VSVEMRSVVPMRVSSHGIACVRQEILSLISIMFRIGGAKMDARLSTFSTLGRPYFVHVGHPACASSATCNGWPLAQYHLCRRCVGASCRNSSNRNSSNQLRSAWLVLLRC